MNEENQVYFADSDSCRKKRWSVNTSLEQDPSFRTNHMEYMEGMEVIQSDIKDKGRSGYEGLWLRCVYSSGCRTCLANETCSIEDFKALLSPQRLLIWKPWQRQRRSQKSFRQHSIHFTPLYIANYCQNYCIYCGFNCYNNIRRKKLTFEETEHEMQVIAKQAWKRSWSLQERAGSIQM